MNFKNFRVGEIVIGLLVIIYLIAWSPQALSLDYCCKWYSIPNCSAWTDYGMIDCPEDSETQCPISQRDCSVTIYCYQFTCQHRELECKPNCTWPPVVTQQPDCDPDSKVAVSWLEWQVTGLCIGSGPCFCNGCGPVAFQLVRDEPCT